MSAHELRRVVFLGLALFWAVVFFIAVKWL